MPVLADDVAVDIPDGRARMRVTDLVAQDQATIVNALTKYPGQRFPGYGVPAYLDFTIEWFHVLDRFRQRSRDLDFAGHYVQTRARARWTAVANATLTTDAQGRFVSFGTDPVRFEGMPSDETDFAVVGWELNGRYFPR